MDILLATRNAGKVREFSSLFAGLPFCVLSLDSFPIAIDVEETGASFVENARLKAAGYARQCGMYTIADDSGLEVAALDGRPGVYSARYAGENSGYEEKIRQLLTELELENSGNRNARFVAHIALASQDGEIIFEADGICKGNIAREPRGSNGFGYDPIFIPTGFDKTFGELNDEVKHSISHRARAAAKIMRYLRVFA